ncbi:hypothetical protein MASR1M97_01580 [Candidatus Desulfobacillus denitrificans]
MVRVVELLDQPGIEQAVGNHLDVLAADPCSRATWGTVREPRACRMSRTARWLAVMPGSAKGSPART